MMKKRISFLFIIPILCLLSCDSLVSEECACLPPQETTFKSGTSFGFCAGYCFREFSVDNNLNTFFEKTSINPGPDEYPDVQVTSILSQDKYDELLQALNKSSFYSLDDTLSDCLDCADQGAEWVEIIQFGTSKKVVFDAGEEVKEIEELLILLRELRNAYE